MHSTKGVILIFALLFCITSLNATNYYVSSIKGNDKNAGTDTILPKKTIQAASDLTAAGDTVFVMNGTYTNICPGCLTVNITRSGTYLKYIVYTNYPGASPVIKFSGWSGFTVKASYIKISGFEIIGNNANVTLADALAQPGGCTDTSGTVLPKFNGNGISVDGRTIATFKPHHIFIERNKIHDCGAGINALEADYIVIKNNEVYNNCWYCLYGSSGISLLNSWNSDGTTTNHNIISGNKVYGNKLFVPWNYNCKIEDGHGIIIDRNDGSLSTNNLPAYTARTLIENNVCYYNGGSGIHIFRSNYVDVVNNTSFFNGDVLNNGEISVNTATNSTIFNNILYARTGKPFNSFVKSSKVSTGYNVLYNGTTKGYSSPSDIVQNPLFKDTLQRDFSLLVGSPAIDAGTDIVGLYANTDFSGAARPYNDIPDIGAYEYVGSLPYTNTSKNIVVSRVGDGVTTLVTNAPSSEVSLLQFASTVANQSTPVNNLMLAGLTISPTTASEGQLNLSDDGRYLSLIGYDKPTGTAATICQLAATNKIIARINGAGAVDYSTKFPTSANGTAKVVASVDGSAFWVNANNISYVPFGNTSIPTPLLPTPARYLNIIKKQLYLQYAFNNLSVSADALPITTTTLSPVITQTANNFQSFAFLDADSTVSWNGTGYDLLYIADASYGITKYYFNKTTNTWVGASVGTGNAYYPTGGAYSLIARMGKSGHPMIYSIGVQNTTGNNRLTYTMDTAGRTSPIKPVSAILAQAGANYVFRGLSFAPEAVVLPVNLISFSGYRASNHIELQWVTTAEINAQQFVVERSADGRNYHPVGSVAARNSSGENRYSYTDEGVNHTAYYRLKMVDKDGTFTYSKVVQIQSNPKQEVLAINPNPIKDYIIVTHPLSGEGATVEIIHSNGVVMSRVSVAARTTQTRVDVSKLRKGYYLVVYKNEGKLITIGCVK